MEVGAYLCSHDQLTIYFLRQLISGQKKRKQLFVPRRYTRGRCEVRPSGLPVLPLVQGLGPQAHPRQTRASPGGGTVPPRRPGSSPHTTAVGHQHLPQCGRKAVRSVGAELHAGQEREVCREAQAHDRDGPGGGRDLRPVYLGFK